MPLGLWENGYSNFSRKNNRIPVHKVIPEEGSLRFIHVDKILIHIEEKSTSSPKLAVRGEFIYNGETYKLDITDPLIKEMGRNKKKGTYSIQNAYLCISLTEPYTSKSGTFVYKVIASIITDWRKRYE